MHCISKCLLADPEDVPALNQTLSEWRARRSDLVKQLKQTESAGGGKTLVTRAMAALDTLEESIASADTTLVKSALASVIVSLTLEWDDDPGQRYHRLQKGELLLRNTVYNIECLPYGRMT